jgi:OPA family sugar phosphate sensor protein UhpC-like MFS transporter
MTAAPDAAPERFSVALRRRALVTSWVAYATYYLARKNWSAIKNPIGHELGLSLVTLGNIDTAFLAAYALGQFPSGLLGDRIGARRLIGAGMLVSALACAAFGAASGALVFGACFVVHGLAQATGWPGTTRVVAEWTRPENRGTVMGVWCTCYQLGSLVATPLAGALAAHFGWRSALFGPALALALVGSVVLASLPAAPAPTAGNVSAPSVGVAQKRALASRTLWLFGTSYFFIKLVRYALLYWLPLYLAHVAHYSTQRAANVSAAFDAGGFVGVMLLGRLADRSRRLSRPALCALWTFSLVPVLYAYSKLGAGSTLVSVLVLALVGVLLSGPDSLLSGAAAQDVAGTEAAAMATGFVNGIGSVGAVVQGLVVPRIVPHVGDGYDWSWFFPALALFALGAVLVLLPALRGAKPTKTA